LPAPPAHDEIAKVMGFWLELGLSGFRVDTMPFFLETDGAGWLRVVGPGSRRLT